MAPKVVEIRNIIEGKFERVELSREAAAHLINAMYAAFAPMKLTGPTMEPPEGTQLLTMEACRDYADDFAYDEQQCRLRLSQRSWEEFDLSDAAFLLGYLHVVSLEVRYSAFPYMAEVILRSKDWVMAFDALVSRLRDDLRNSRIDLPLAHRFEMAQAVVAFLEAAGQQAESLGIHESPTVIARTAKLWKGLATVSQ
jgi:hypothetical protein